MQVNLSRSNKYLNFQSVPKLFKFDIIILWNIMSGHFSNLFSFLQPSSSGDDRAMCFTCSVCLVCWEPTDEPWYEYTCNCLLLAQLRGLKKKWCTGTLSCKIQVMPSQGISEKIPRTIFLVCWCVPLFSSTWMLCLDTWSTNTIKN